MAETPLSVPQRGIISLLRATSGQAGLALLAALLRRALDAAAAVDAAGYSPTALPRAGGVHNNDDDDDDDNDNAAEGVAGGEAGGGGGGGGGGGAAEPRPRRAALCFSGGANGTLRRPPLLVSACCSLRPAQLALGARAAEAAQQGAPALMALHNIVAALTQATAPGLVVATPGLSRAAWLFVQMRAAHAAGLLLSSALAPAGGAAVAAAAAAAAIAPAAPAALASRRATNSRGASCVLARALEVLDFASLALLAALWALLALQLFGLRWAIDIAFD